MKNYHDEEKALDKSLNSNLLYHACDLSQFGFNNTASLIPLDQPLGQQRALEAFDFGIDIDQSGFNLFVHGASGLGKHQLVQQVLSKTSCSDKPLSD